MEITTLNKIEEEEFLELFAKHLHSMSGIAQQLMQCNNLTVSDINEKNPSSILPFFMVIADKLEDHMKNGASTIRANTVSKAGLSVPALSLLRNSEKMLALANDEAAKSLIEIMDARMFNKPRSSSK